MTTERSTLESDRTGARAFSAQPAGEAPRPPVWLVVAVAAGVVAGGTVGVLTGAKAGEQLASAVFHAAAFAYLITSVADLLEHLRLERIATGRWWAHSVVPVGESVNHLATVLTLAAFLSLVRPPPAVLELRDWIVLAAPGVFLALGWRDEVVYHRRRSTHREDIIHTVSHLAAGVMLAGAVASKMVRW